MLAISVLTNAEKLENAAKLAFTIRGFFYSDVIQTTDAISYIHATPMALHWDSDKHAEVFKLIFGVAEIDFTELSILEIQKVLNYLELGSSLAYKLSFDGVPENLVLETLIQNLSIFITAINHSGDLDPGHFRSDATQLSRQILAAEKTTSNLHFSKLSFLDYLSTL